MSTIVVMPGGFHPFHAGHAALYNSARRAFPDAEVFVAATNDTSTRPFPFAVKEKLAKLAGVEPGHFVQVKSPFRAEEITSQFNPDVDSLIFVRSEKDKTKPPQAGGNKKDGSPAYLQPLLSAKRLEPFGKHAYMAYLPTVEFGPGMTSATEIRAAWPTLNEKRKTALVMSLYPRTQSNPKLAATVVKMLDAAIGNQLSEFEGDVIDYPPVAGTPTQSTPTTEHPPRRGYSIHLIAGPGSNAVNYRGGDCEQALCGVFPRDYPTCYNGRPGPDGYHSKAIMKISEAAVNGSAVVKSGIGSEDIAETLVAKLVKYGVPDKYWRITSEDLDEGVAEGSLNEFAPGAGDEGGGEDPYKYPKPESYRRSIDFFGQFEADHFDREDFDDATGVFKGYWGDTQIAYFKFNNPARTGNDDPGMGWYYEPESNGNSDTTSTKPAVDRSDERKKQELGMINAFLKSGNRPNPDSQIGQLMKKHGLAEGLDKKEATRRIQKMLNDKYKANLDVDGILGPLTLKSINKFVPKARAELADEPNKTTAVQGKKVKEQNVVEMDGQNFVGGMTASYQQRENQPIDEDYIDEKWSQKYKSSINCANPKGFSQRAHCAGRKK